MWWHPLRLYRLLRRATTRGALQPQATDKKPNWGLGATNHKKTHLVWCKILQTNLLWSAPTRTFFLQKGKVSWFSKSAGGISQSSSIILPAFSLSLFPGQVLVADEDKANRWVWWSRNHEARSVQSVSLWHPLSPFKIQFNLAIGWAGALKLIFSDDSREVTILSVSVAVLRGSKNRVPCIVKVCHFLLHFSTSTILHPVQ